MSKSKKATQFAKTLQLERLPVPQKGKIIILSGMSGCGKTYIANMLVEKFNCMFVKKYVTRPFREEEMKAKMNGENIRNKSCIWRF